MRSTDNSARRLESRNALTRGGFIPALASRAIVVRLALSWPGLVGKPKPHPPFGALAGLGRTAPGVDLTEPADPDWADRVERLYPRHDCCAAPVGVILPRCSASS
jgi:hypothetical protein